jgi:hypothetical protein
VTVQEGTEDSKNENKLIAAQLLLSSEYKNSELAKIDDPEKVGGTVQKLE